MYELILFGILYFAWILYSLDLYFTKYQKAPNADNKHVFLILGTVSRAHPMSAIFSFFGCSHIWAIFYLFES